MADEFHLGSGNWWDTSRNRSFDSGTTPSPSISTTLNVIASYGWPTEMVDMKSSESETASTAAHDQSSGGGGGGALASSNLHMMGLGLSSQNMEWNQALLGDKGESSFRSLLQEGLTSNSGGFQQDSGAAAAQQHWRQKVYSGVSPEDSPVNDFKQINHRGFSLEQPQFSSQASNSNDSTITSQNLSNTSFQVDSTAAYGLLLPENQQHHPHSAYQNRPMNYNPYPSSGGGYGGNVSEMVPAWNKYPQFLRTSPPKQQPPPPQAAAASNTHLHFVNSTPFWNPSTGGTDGRSSFSPVPALQTQNIPAAQSFDEKPKNASEVAKKNTSEPSNKRPRSETPSPLPAFKVRKEKMGDRITALQQLVSPFGKTDTASVLSEAIEYIKFLHEQVSALSTPYMKNGAPAQHQQNFKKSKDPDEGDREDLRSRGLCLVPVSSTFPVTQETAVDFWTPTFGVTFR